MSDPKTLDAAALDDIDRRVHYLTGGIFIDVSIAEMESLLAMARRTLAAEELVKELSVTVALFDATTETSYNVTGLLAKAKRFNTRETDHD